METTEFVVSEKRRAVWNTEIEIFEAFRAICDRHGLTYFADSGTLLGAVRHKGFIPWDDDIDISMMRDDYEKFLKYAAEELPKEYFLQIPSTEEDYFYGHAKIRKNGTTAIRQIQYPERYTHHQGVFVDIFPMDNVPDGKVVRAFHKFVALKMMQFIYYAKYYYRLNKHSLKTKIKHRISCILLPSNKAVRRAYRRYEKWVRRYNKKQTAKIGCISMYYNLSNFIWPREWFNEKTELPFENITMAGPAEYDRILTYEYGDYMTPVHAPTEHGEVYFDLEHNYTDYYDGTRSFTEDDLKL